jgi:hypothetical chaperone protein
MPLPRCYAIDFGTSNSLLAATDGDKIIPPISLDPAAADPTVLKSVLYTPATGQWYFGAEAVNQYGIHQAEGRLFRSLKKYLPDPGFSGTHVHSRYYNLPELISVFLRELRDRANAFFNKDVTTVILGRPAVFANEGDKDQLAEKRLTTAAQLAGFKDVMYCPEPVAAAYEFRHQLDRKRLVLIADFGGGTSDFTVLNMDRERFRDSDILATHGISIAGDRFDGAIMKHMIAPHFGSEVVYRMPMGSNDLHLPRQLINKMCSAADISFLSRGDILTLLKEAQKWSITPVNAERMDRLFVLIEEHLGYKLFRSIEQSKIELSQADSAVFSFDYPGIGIEEELASTSFRTVSSDIVGQIVAALDETLRLAGVKASDIEIVCCTGGTARIPELRFELERRFGSEALRQHRHFHSVVGGLAERAIALGI